MGRTTLLRTLAPVASAGLVLALAACGSDPVTTPSTGGGGSAAPTGDASTAPLSGELRGAGATSQDSAMQAWIAGFQSSNPDLTINYNPVGSGGGRTQFIDGAVAFAGSDSVMDEEESAASAKRCGGEPAIHLPDYISPIAVAFNLPDVPSVNMEPATIAKVFAGEITTWNDPAIAADNPGVTLPDTKITPVHRSDESGTTDNFTQYLAATASDVWTSEPDGVWPLEGGEAAQGTSGVVSAIQAAEGAVGYADASQVGELGTVAVGVGSEYVEYSPEAAAKVVAESKRVPGGGEYDIALELARDTTTAGSYPIVLVSYHIVCLTYADAAQGEAVKGFIGYVASDAGQQAAAAAAGSAPVTGELLADIQKSVAAIEVG